MASAAIEPGAEDLRRLLDVAVRRLETDEMRLRRALRAIPPGQPAPRSVFELVAASRRQLLRTFGTVLALNTTHPAKALLLEWLSLGVAGSEAFYRALRADRSAPKIARREREIARRHFLRAEDAFAGLDKALGCPYHCEIDG